MATLTIHGLDKATIQKLREIAAEHGHSPEEEARDILVRVVHQAMQKGLGTLITQEFKSIGGAELELPTRSERGRSE